MKKNNKKNKADDYVISDPNIKIWESNILASAPTKTILHTNVLKLYLWSVYESIKYCETNKTNLDVNIDKKIIEINYPISKFAEFFKIKKSNIFPFLKEWGLQIQEYKYFLIDEVSEELAGFTVFPYFHYKTESGKLTLHLNRVLNKHFLGLKTHKTTIELDILRHFSNPRFIKMLEYFRAKVFQGQINRIVQIKVDDLKKLLVVSEDKYKYFKQFRQWVLTPILKDFKKFKAMDVEMETVRTGRYITSCRFKVSNYGNHINEVNSDKQACLHEAFVQKDGKYGIFNVCLNKECNKTWKADSNKIQQKEDELAIVENNNIGVNNQNKKDNYFDRTLNVLFNSNENNSGIELGFEKLDNLLGGFKAKSINVVAGDTGCGKSAFLLNILKNLQFEINEINTLEISLEMDEKDLLQRSYCNIFGIKMDEWSSLKKEDFVNYILQLKAKRLNKRETVAQGGMTIEVIANFIRDYVKTNNLHVVVIDHLRNIKASYASENEFSTLNKSMKQLQNLAKELDIIFIVVSQVNRASMQNVEQNKKARLTINSLFGSSIINQLADTILLMHKSKTDKNVVEIEVAKNRHGKNGTVEFVFNKDLMRFREK